MEKTSHPFFPKQKKHDIQLPQPQLLRRLVGLIESTGSTVISSFLISRFIKKNTHRPSIPLNDQIRTKTGQTNNSQLPNPTNHPNPNPQPPPPQKKKIVKLQIRDSADRNWSSKLLSPLLLLGMDGPCGWLPGGGRVSTCGLGRS